MEIHNAHLESSPADQAAARPIKRLIHKIWAIAKILLMVSVVVLFVGVLYSESKREPILVEPFEVPKSLSEQGHSPRALAHQLIDKLNWIESIVRSRQRQQFVTHSQQTQLDVEVTGVKFSLRPLVDLIKERLGFKTYHVVTEIALQGKDRIVITTRVLGEEPTAVLRPIAELDSALFEAGKHVYGTVRPSDLANYFFQTGDYSGASYAVGNAIRTRDKADQIRALALWGQIYEADKEYGAAIEKFEAAIQSAPANLFLDRWTSGRVTNALAYAHLMFGNMYANSYVKYDPAIEHFKQAIALDSGLSSAAHVSWGWALYNQGEVSEAMNHYDQALANDDRDPDARNNIGVSKMDQGRLFEAATAFQFVSILAPRFVGPYVNWAKARRRLGDSAANREEPFRMAVAAMQSDIDPTLFTEWGNFLRAQGQYREAAKQYEKAVEAAGQFSAKGGGVGDVRLANALIEWGMLLARQCQERAAEEKFRSAIKAHPRYEGGYLELARLLSRRGRDAEAEVKLREAYFANADTDYNVAVVRGDIWQQRGRLDAAMAEYGRAVEAFAWGSEAYSGWGKVLLIRGMTNEAAERFGAAIRVSPGDIGNRLDYAEALARAGRSEDAIAQVREELSLNPVSAWGLVEWGGPQRAASQTLERYRQAAEGNAEHVRALPGLLRTLIALGRDEDAKKIQARMARSRKRPDCGLPPEVRYEPLS